MADKRQPPVNKKLIGPVINAIDFMENRQLALAKQAFSGRDLLTLFVDPQHHDTLTKAYALCEPSGHTQDLFVAFMAAAEFGGAIVHLRFYWHGPDVEDGFYVPYHRGAVMNNSASIREEAPLELKDRVRETVHDLIGIHYRFNQVRKVLSALNRPTVCTSLAAMRYHWPCIVPILRTARLVREADGLIDPNPRAGATASISNDLRKKLAVTNQTIANHQLIADVPLPPALPIAYDLRHNFR